MMNNMKCICSKDEKVYFQVKIMWSYYPSTLPLQKKPALQQKNLLQSK
jgi:hypothetical protein